jgi:hypothetical protein
MKFRMKSILYGIGGLVVVGILTTGCGTLGGELGGIPCVNLFGWMSSKDDQTCVTPANAKYLKEKRAREYAEEQAAHAAGRSDQYRAEKQAEEEQKQADRDARNAVMTQMAINSMIQNQQINDQLHAQRMAQIQQGKGRVQTGTTTIPTPVVSAPSGVPQVAKADGPRTLNSCIRIQPIPGSKSAYEAYNSCGEPAWISYCFLGNEADPLWRCNRNRGGADTVGAGKTRFPRI